jgi:hypothetical protein
MKTMKNPARRLALASLSLAAALAACGGGGDDEAGSLTTFSVQPATVTFTAPAGTADGVCLPGGTQDVYVYGGAAPYRIDNTMPAYISVNKTEVGDRGGSFTLTVTGGCVTNGTIVVVDKLDRQVVFTVNNSPASTSTTSAAPSNNAAAR